MADNAAKLAALIGAAPSRPAAPYLTGAGAAAIDASDATLLQWFVARGDQAAFAELVRRHGPMVLGVCRRRLRRREDADDAFQATFLVLATKAAALKRPGLLSNWLFGVALRAVRESKRSAARRRAGEERLMASLGSKSARVDEPLDPERSEALSALDEEIGRLPEKHRAAVVLCYLQGKSRAEAARQLGRPEGTVATCLARAKDLLRRRLARRGVATSAAALTVTLARDLAGVSVPPALAASTAEAAALVAAGKSAAAAGLVSEAAAALTKGVFKAMFLTKLTTLSVLLLAAVLTVGGAGAAMSAVNAADAAARHKDWRQRFDAAYNLKPGEVMKLIPPPFIPERGDYVRMTEGDASYPLTGSLVLQSTADGKQQVNQYTVETVDEGAAPVSSHLDACGLAKWEAEGDLRTVMLEGDWVVRLDATRDQRVAALQEILRRQLNKPGLSIQKRQVDRDVVVARGRLVLAPVVAANDNTIYVAAGAKLGKGTWGSCALNGFLERLGGVIGCRVIDETQAGGREVSWAIDVSASRARENPAEIRKLLDNLSRQTGLQLKTERRPMTVYVLGEEKAAGK